MKLKIAFSIIGLIIFILPMIINIFYVIFSPKEKIEENKNYPKWLEVIEQGSRALYFLTICFLVSKDTIGLKSPFLWLSAIFLALYYLVWLRYFINDRKIELLKKSFLLIPFPLAIFPVLYFFFAALWLHNYVSAIITIIFGICHITITILSFSNLKNTVVVYIFGKGGRAAEAKHYKPFFPNETVIGFNYKASFPWDAKKEFLNYFTKLKVKYKHIIIIANSIGAFLAMSSLNEDIIEKALFISPIVNMEQLIYKLMKLANVDLNELKEKKKIPTKFGETLSYKYLCYTINNPISWNVKTAILYGENDHLTSLKEISSFTKEINANLTIMPNGEHWFHTKEQMDFLDNWLIETKKIFQLN